MNNSRPRNTAATANSGSRRYPTRASLRSPPTSSSDDTHSSHQHPMQRSRTTSFSTIDSPVLPHSPGSSSNRGKFHAATQVAFVDGVWICALIFGGCCSNVFTLEMIIQQMPQSASLVTFFQFLLVSLEGVLYGGFVRVDQIHTVHPSLRGYIPKDVRSKRRSLLPFSVSLKPCVIPIYHWLGMVVMFWTLSMMNNWALDYRIDMPLHILFKSGGLMLNMLMGYLVMGKQYSTPQVLSVAMISFGVMVATWASASDFRVHSSHDKPAQSLAHWLSGISLLSMSLLISSTLGLYQEHTYRKYGKQWREGLFYTHFLGLPFFIMLRGDIMQQFSTVLSSPYVSLGDVCTQFGANFILSVVPSFMLSVAMPKLLLLVLLNAASQYVCISGVHQLTTIATSLTVNLVLTFRKFVSLLISIYFFQAYFGVGHWFGTSLVFIGTLVYSVASTRRHLPQSRVRAVSGRWKDADKIS